MILACDARTCSSFSTTVGGKLRGGRFYGTWPGLEAEHLDEGVDLAVATDYRRVLTEILEMQRAKRLDGVFANYAYPGPLGLFGDRPPEKA